MISRSDIFLLLVITTSVCTKEPELPLCPTNVNYFPQSLPMHCRLPSQFEQRETRSITFPPLPSFPPDFFQSPPPNNLPGPIPFPVPSGFPGPMFPPAPYPGIPVPMSPQGPAHKLPVIVMPFYSPDPSYTKPDSKKKRKDSDKRRKHKPSYSSSSTETESDTNSESDTDGIGGRYSEGGWWGGRKNWRKGHGRKSKRNKHPRNHRRMMQRLENSDREKIDLDNVEELLTPVLQYVSKDGYVIFEKEISKHEAKNWLGKTNNMNENKATYKEVDELMEQDAPPLGRGHNEIEVKSHATMNVGRLVDGEEKQEQTQVPPEVSQAKRRQHRKKMKPPRPDPNAR